MGFMPTNIKCSGGGWTTRFVDISLQLNQSSHALVSECVRT